MQLLLIIVIGFHVLICFIMLSLILFPVLFYFCCFNAHGVCLLLSYSFVLACATEYEYTYFFF